MSFLPSIFSGTDSITIEEVDSYIDNLSHNVNVDSNLLDLIEASRTHSKYISENALPTLFNLLIQSKMNDDIIADIFQVINNLISDTENSSINSSLIINYDLALPCIIDCINTEKAKKKIAVIQIITRLAILQPTQLQQHLTNDQDRLVHFLTLVEDSKSEVIHDFLSLLPILVLNNTDFQQLFAFNIIEKLVKLIEKRIPLAISALRALLSSNLNTQNLFFGTVENLSVIANLLKENDSETLALFIELFSGQNASNFRHFLKGSDLIQIIIEKALEGKEQFIRLLGLSIKNEHELCNLLKNDEKMNHFLRMYLQSRDEVIDLYFVSFFKSFLFQSDDSSNFLADIIVAVEDRNDEKLINLAVTTILSSSESKITFLTNSPNFTISMIGFMISHINFETVLHFLIVLCWESKNGCYEIVNESSDPISFIKEFMPNEAPLIQAQCSLLLRIIYLFADNSSKLDTSDIEQLNTQIRDLSTYLSTLEANDYYDFLRKVISEILSTNSLDDDNDAVAINQEIQPESESDNNSADENHDIFIEEIIEEEEEEDVLEPASNDKSHQNQIDDVIGNYDQILSEMNNKSLEERIQMEVDLKNAKSEISNLKQKLVSDSCSAVESDLIQKQFEEFRSQQKEEISRIINENNDEKRALETNYKSEIELLQSQISSLQSRIDATTLSSDKEISDLKQKIISTELDCAQKVNHLRNMNRETLSKQTEELREQCQVMKRDIDILKSQHKALFSQQIEEFKDEQVEFMKIVDENKSLKFKISQILKDNEHLKIESQNLKATLNEHSNFALTTAALSDNNNSLINKNSDNDNITNNNANSNTNNNVADSLIVSLKAQINDLQSQNRALLQKDSENQREISNLQNLNASSQEIRDNWEDYMSQSNRLKSENESLKSQLSQANNSNKEYQKTNNSNRIKIDELSSQLADSQKVVSSVKTLVNQNGKLQNDIERLNSQNVQMEIDLNILKSQSSNKQLVDLMNQNSELKKSTFEAEQLKAQNSELSQTLDALKKDNSIFHSQILDFERKVTRLETENTILKGNSMSGLASIDSSQLKPLISEFALQNKDLNSKILDLNSQLSAIQNVDANKKVESENSELKQQVIQSTVKMNNLQDENSLLKSQLKKLQQESATLRQRLEFTDDDNTTIESLAQNSSELSQKLEAKDAEINELKNKLCTSQELLQKQILSDNEAREQEMSTLRTFLTSNASKYKVLAEMKSAIDKKSSQISQLIMKTTQLSSFYSHQLSRQKRQIEQLKMRTTDNKQRGDDTGGLKRDLEQLKSENAILRNNISDLNQRVERLTNDNGKLAKHAQHLTNKFREVSRENADLHKNNSIVESNGSSSSSDILLKQKIEKKREKIRQMSASTSLDSLQQQLQFAKSESDRQQEHILSLIQQNKALITQVTELNTCLSENSSYNQIRHLREELQNILSNNSELKDRLRKTDAEKLAAMQQKAATVEQLRNAMSDLRMLQDRHNELQKHFNKIKKKYIKLKLKSDFTSKYEMKSSQSLNILNASDQNFDITETNSLSTFAPLSPISLSSKSSPRSQDILAPKSKKTIKKKGFLTQPELDEVSFGGNNNESFEPEIEPFANFSPQKFLEGSRLTSSSSNDDSQILGRNESMISSLLYDGNGQNTSLLAVGNEPPLFSDHDEEMAPYINHYYDDTNNENEENDMNNQDYYNENEGIPDSSFGTPNNNEKKKALRVIGQLWLKKNNSNI